MTDESEQTGSASESSYGTGSRAEKPRLTLHPANLWIIGVTAVGWLGLLFWLLAQIGSTHAVVVSRGIGLYIGAFLVSGFVALIAYWLGRRSSRAGNVVFAIMFLVYFGDRALGFWFGVRNAAARAASVRYAEEKRAALAAAEQGAAEDLASGETTGSAAAIGRMSDAFRKVSGTATIEQRMAAANAGMLSELQAETARLNEKYEKVQDSIDLSKISTKEQLEQRIREIREYVQGIEQFIAFYGKLPEKLLAVMEQEKPTKQEVEVFRTRARISFKLDENRRYREQGAVHWNAVADYLDSLNEQWGNWEWDPKEKRVIFASTVEDSVVTDINGRLKVVRETQKEMTRREATLRGERSN